MENNKNNEEKTFLVFNTACFGDVLLCNSLCQNIKNIFPNSKTVFITDKNWADAARHQEAVDDVVVYDKRGIHKGIKGFIRFIKDFKYKNIYASVITYSNERNYLLSLFLKSKHILMTYKNINLPTQEKHNHLLKSITKQPIKNYPIKYNLPNNTENPLNNIISPDMKYIALCCGSKNPIKDLPVETAIELINMINEEGLYKVALVGAGKDSLNYSKQLEDAGCNFINLVNKTSLLELGKVIADSQCLISVDTGTMHFGYALQKATVAVFYNIKSLRNWAPNPQLYNTITLASNQTAQNIYTSCKILIGDKKDKKVSVVIPTLQKNTELLTNLLKTLEQDNSVDEILVIDNSKKGLNYTNEKLKVIIPEENMYVNPSWNFGAKEAKNEIVALLNDDIAIPVNFCSHVIEKMDYKMGCIGACYNYLKETKEIEYNIQDTNNLNLTPIDLITRHWGVTIFFYKSSYINIPDEIKIFRGDDWLFYQNKAFGRQNYFTEGQPIYHYGSLTSRSKVLKPIGRKDRHYYRKYTKKWYQHYFDIEEQSDCYRLTIFGLKINLNTKKQINPEN